MCLLGFGDHDGLQQLVQLVLDEVRQLTHPALVHLNHVQIQLELLGDGRVGGLAELGILSGLAGRTDRWWRWGRERQDSIFSPAYYRSVPFNSSPE